MDKLQTNLSFFANEIEKTRKLIKQRKDKLATTQEVYIPQNHTFSYDGREFNTREHFSILKQRSLNNQDDDFNGFDTLMREAIENALNIKPIKEFGTNYAEHYHSGETAIQKLLAEAQAHKESGVKGEYKGQVAGAFHRKELGDIDLVWGNDKIGLQKIVEKHLNDFADFAGNNPYEKMSNAINEIIQNGKLLTENGVNTLWYKNGDEYYLVGISKGFNKKGDNNWVITSYKKDNITDLQKEKVDKLFSSDAEVLSAQGKFNELETLNSTTSDIIPQTPQEIIKQAKASGKSVAETKELIQKNKELQKHNNTESTPTINNTHSNKELKSSIKENIESTPQNTITQTLKDELKAADNTQKVAIVTRELEKQNEVLLKQYKELQDIVKNKDYTSLEIQEALDYIATNKKFETDTSIVVYNPIDSKDRGVYITKAAPQDERAKQFLKWKYTHLEQKPLMDIIKKNKSDISKLKWDLEFIKNKSNKMRLEKNLARLEKSLLKEEQEYLKSLSLTYDLNTQEGLQKTKDLFYRAKPTQEQIELFESILPVAKKLGVEVRNAIRDPYQVGGNTKNKSGTYFLKENSARVKHSISQADKSETLLHELIHSVTSRAMYAKEKGATHLLNKEQIQAIDNIESIYKQIVEKKDELGFKSWNAREKTGDYGLKNSHEMIAELSNPKFANKLKGANVFEKIIDNIIQLFVSTAEMIGLKKSNAYDKLRENVKNIIENYKDNFSQEYEKLGVRNVGLESKELESSFLDSSGKIDYKALESFAIPLPKQLRYKDFIMQFNNSKKATIQTPIKELEINPKYAFYHLMKNGKMGNKKQDRLTLNGGILETLQNPLFITKDKKDTYYFYKPFKDEKGLIYLVSVEVDKNNKLLYKTSYETDDDRMEKMIKKI